VLAYVAEQKRQNIKQRQTEGIEIAKVKGKHLGRQKATFPDNFDDVYKKWKARHITTKKAIQESNLKPTTFYKLVAQYENIEYRQLSLKSQPFQILR
jgi:DNA invertase Pin-like site-specific DNA recombinase